jgi:large subunit ribosomal protein L18
MATAIVEQSRRKRHQRIRKRIVGTTERPRLCVHRSSKNLMCQTIDDGTQLVVLGLSTTSKKFKSESAKGSTVEGAKSFGKLVSVELKAKGVNKITFDRSGHLYHGRIKAFADALREGGIDF